MNHLKIIPEKLQGVLLVGRNARNEVIINHGDLKPDAAGVGHIVFSIDQARSLARLLLQSAAYAEWDWRHPELAPLAEIKVWEMNGCDWYAAATLEDAMKAMAENLGFDTTPDAIAEMREEHKVADSKVLADEAMERLTFRDEDEDGGVHYMTFRAHLEEMIADGEKFPCFFASTEG